MRLRDFRSPTAPSPLSRESQEPIRAELLSPERLEELAERVARRPVLAGGTSGRLFSPRARDSGRVLLQCYREIAAAIREEGAITPAAEWLVDNFHIVDEQLRRDPRGPPARILPPAPQARGGAARRDIRGSSAWPGRSSPTPTAAWSPRRCGASCAAFQRVQPLTIGELWAIPIALRLVLVENLRRLAERIVQRPGRAPGRRRARRRAARARRADRAAALALQRLEAAPPVARLHGAARPAAARAGSRVAPRRCAGSTSGSTAQGTTRRRARAARAPEPGRHERDRAQRDHEHAPDGRVRLGRLLRERQPGGRAARRGPQLPRDGLRHPRSVPSRDRGPRARLRAVRARRHPARDGPRPARGRGRAAHRRGPRGALDRSRLLPARPGTAACWKPSSGTA